MFGDKARERKVLARIEELSKAQATVAGRLDARHQQLEVATELQSTKKELVEAQLELSKIQEKHDRERREIEHKLGLHRTQVEQERKSAVQEAKLAVREEALEAQQGRFEKEMEFMQTRFEDEVKSQRVLVEQVLTRLPVFEHKRVEHVGVDPNPPQRLAIEE